MHETSTNEFHKMLATYELSLPEFSVLLAAGYGRPLDPGELACMTYEEFRGDPRGEVTASEAKAAVKGCIARGLLRVIGEEHGEPGPELRRTTDYPSCTVSQLLPGMVDFTAKGACVYEDIRGKLQEIYGYRDVPSGDNSDTPGQVDVYAAEEARCREIAEDMKTNPTHHWGGGEVTILSVSEPEPIGPWWQSRWRLVPRGFRARVRYSFKDDTQMPEE